MYTNRYCLVRYGTRTAVVDWCIRFVCVNVVRSKAHRYPRVLRELERSMRTKRPSRILIHICEVSLSVGRITSTWILYELTASEAHPIAAPLATLFAGAIYLRGRSAGC